MTKRVTREWFITEHVLKNRFEFRDNVNEQKSHDATAMAITIAG